MLQQAEGDDYILATGETHSVREFVGRAAEIAGFKLEWDGSADKERGIDRRTGREIVRVNPKFYRPVEVDPLTGDSSKARKKLGWEPRLTFDQLVEMMMEADLKRVARSGGPTLRSVA
jgi:GDPmannose 4,6-dehydratase